MTPTAVSIIAAWPEESREAAQVVIDAHGEPDEASVSELTWFDKGEWKRIVAQRAFWAHDFPAPHHDSVETFIDYQVPLGKYTSVAEFDGSIMLERTSGEVSARCHDEQANRLALNLMHDIVVSTKDVAEARDYYAKEFLDARRKQPTPYMTRLQFQPQAGSADADQRVLTDKQLEDATAEGGT